MNRLRDESAADAMVGRGIDILRSTPGTPLMPEARGRVWAAVEYEAGRLRRKETLRLSPLRVFALIAALLLVGGTAGAVIGHEPASPSAGAPRGPARARPPGLKTAMALRARPLPPRRVPRRDATPQPIAPGAGDHHVRRAGNRAAVERGATPHAGVGLARRGRRARAVFTCSRRWTGAGGNAGAPAGSRCRARRRYPGSLPCGSSAGRAARRSDGSVDRGRGRAG